MKVAYFSPLNPIRSGISDFSEELLPYLINYMEIDLYIDDYIPLNIDKKDFTVYNISDYEKNRNNYDITVYHVGNNYKYHKSIVDTFMKFGGILELHDVSMHNYIAADTIETNNPQTYIDLMKYSHGIVGEEIAKKYLNGMIEAPWENSSSEFTVNKHLIDHAEAIIVHSDYAKQIVKGINQKKKVINIGLHTPDIIKDFSSFKMKCRKKLLIDSDIAIIGSFGYATETKRIVQVLEALNNIKKAAVKKFHYYIVGDTNSDYIRDKINEMNLQDEVTITGFTTLDDFKLYMGACDICINLRYPTQGETSASLHRMFGMGKPVLVTQIGSFEEYPDDIAIKIPYDNNEVSEIYNAINRVLTDKLCLNNMSEKSYIYALENYNVKDNAYRYFRFFSDIINDSYQEEYIDSFIDKLVDLGLIGEFYLEHIAKDKLDDVTII